MVRMLNLAAAVDDPLAWWLARISEPSFVYVIQTMPGTPVKIGVARDVRARLAGLQTGNPYPLNLLYVFPGGTELECQLHHILRRHRMLGEWFTSDGAEAMFPKFEKLSRGLMAAYRDDGRTPSYKIVPLGWRARRSRTEIQASQRFVEPEPVDPEVAAQRLTQAWMRPRRKGTTQLGSSRDATTII